MSSTVFHGDHSDAPQLPTNKAMVNFGSNECFESSAAAAIGLLGDHILEAPEEFRCVSKGFARDKDNETERDVSAECKCRGAAGKRDHLNIQDVTCGCTSQEMICVEQRENAGARGNMDKTRLETINAISDCAASSGDNAMDAIDKMKIAAMNDRNRSSSFINKCADGGHIDELGGVGAARGSACEMDSGSAAACGVRETETPPSIADGAVICATAPGCSRVADAPANACDRERAPRSAVPPEDSESEAVPAPASASPPPPPPPPSLHRECCPAADVPAILRDINSIAAHADYAPSDLSLELINTKRELSKLKEHVQSWGAAEIRNELLLSSKALNKRTADGRLRHLGAKLKAAGIEDAAAQQDVQGLAETGKKQVVDDDYDANQNLVRAPAECNEIYSEFDVSKYDTYACLASGDYFVVYDELEEADGDAEDADENESDSGRTMKSMMGTDGERKQHNPDKDNLKSLLKKPGRGKDRKHRVIFKEDKNEFFDADYIILIREDCDYDEEDDDGVCTCNQHEMVRLTCCEPNCNCNVYEFDPTPQSPKFAPPLEFVDAVTLSPPDGYKDMELGEQQIMALREMAARRGQLAPMAPVCRECSQTHCEDGEYSEEEQQSDQETEKTDQSQQTTPTTPPPDEESSDGQKVQRSKGAPQADKRCEVEMNDDSLDYADGANIPPGGSPISGILKGGRLWKQQSGDVTVAIRAPPPVEPIEPPQQPDVAITSDDECGGKRSVRFIESNGGGGDQVDGGDAKAASDDQKHHSVSPEATEMTLTFKLGNHILISNNSLKPNSAVRQLFPCTKPHAGADKAGEEGSQYLVTSESLKAFDEAKKLKLPQIEADESIKRVIERNTLRRSLIRYEPRAKKNVQKTDNSLVERIKLLTCDVDEPLPEDEQARASPAGEEAKSAPEVAMLKTTDKSFSPASSSSSNSSGSATYKRLTDLFGKKDRPDIQEIDGGTTRPQAPDLGGPQEFIDPHNSIGKLHAAGGDNRKQFLATLGPLSACVGGTVHAEDYYYQTAGDRMSMASSIGTEYSLEDIEEGLKKDEESKRTPPDVLAGTPSASESGDELAMFVQQDASRIERIKKKYQQDDEEDEHDDYGFNRRPSVRGIKPRFGTTTEIMQQIQQQIQPPTTNSTLPRSAPVAWPYYSETNLSGVDNKRNINNQAPNYQYAQYRPTTLVDENAYQNCANQQQPQQQPPAPQPRCPQVTYRSNMNVYTSSPIMRIGGGCTDYYQSLPRNRNGRPQSPPPQEVTKGLHQMMYIPYNHIEGIQGAYYDATYACVNNQNQINKRYIDTTYQEQLYAAAAGKPRASSYTITSRSESPAYSTARSTQTPQTCSYYPPRYRPPNGIAWIDGLYKPSAVNRYRMHSINAVDNISLTDSDSQHSSQMPNGFKDCSIPNSPTKPKFIERGVPEGAASVSSQDGQTLTSPTSPQNPQGAHPTQQPTSKPLFYAMNV